MLKIKLDVKMKCPKHPRYDPEKDYIGGIKGGCQACQFLHYTHEFSRGYVNKIKHSESYFNNTYKEAYERNKK